MYLISSDMKLVRIGEIPSILTKRDFPHNSWSENFYNFYWKWSFVKIYAKDMTKCRLCRLLYITSSCVVVKVIYTKYSKHWPYTVAHTLFVWAENVKSWFKSWVFPFTFQAYILPHTLDCLCVSLFKFHIWILEQF